jgi:hypothetical protein
MTTETDLKALQLNHEDASRIICVTPSDEDRFTIRVDQAIEILKEGIRRDDIETKKFASQFRILLRSLGQWIEKNKSKVNRAYLTIREHTFSFVVIRTETKYDSAFEDAVSELDIAISDDADLRGLSLHSIALPDAAEDSIASFLHPEFKVLLK